uniref:Glucuronosyltransferase n=1 Tax=Lygus hesperus TaxID=30085 RepID=A0A0K8T947_LYGHE
MSGLPDNPSYMIDFKADTTDRMTFIQRLKNVYIWTSTTLFSYYYTVGPQQEVADKYIRYPGWESRPSVVQLARDMDLILVNSHVSLGYPFPKAPHVKEVGGMNLAPNKPLPKDLQDFMDSATDGVIYFSYGSNVDMNELTREGKFDAFIKVFRKLKQKVLWKWKGSEIPKVDAPNVKIQEWFPQQDILAHKNTKIFLTHGGLMSLIEAINHGVPLIGTAVFGDQPKNLRFVEHVGIGVQLKYDNLTEESLTWAVNEILGNPSYKNSMKKRSELFKDRPMTPVDEGVYWVEYVLRHGKVLQPASARMPFYQVYLLDVLGTLVVSALLALWLTKRTLRAICSLCCGNKQNVVPKSKKRQ